MTCSNHRDHGNISMRADLVWVDFKITETQTCLEMLKGMNSEQVKCYYYKSTYAIFNFLIHYTHTIHVLCTLRKTSIHQILVIQTSSTRTVMSNNRDICKM